MKTTLQTLRSVTKEEGGPPGTRTEFPLKPVARTTGKQAVLLQPPVWQSGCGLEGAATHEEPPLEQVLSWSCGPQTRARGLMEIASSGASMMEQSIPEDVPHGTDPY